MTGSLPSWQALQGGIAGEVVLPGSPADQALPAPFNARFHDVRPRAIVLCATPEDVAETISFARRHGLACAPRSGGHCFAGRSVSNGLVPVVMGGGRPFFPGLPIEDVPLGDPEVCVQSARVTHLRMPVLRPDSS
jgi:FAD binding domain